jgi:hypothetical protein
MWRQLHCVSTWAGAAAPAGGHARGHLVLVMAVDYDGAKAFACTTEQGVPRRQVVSRQACCAQPMPCLLYPGSGRVALAQQCSRLQHEHRPHLQCLQYAQPCNWRRCKALAGVNIIGGGLDVATFVMEQTSRHIAPVLSQCCWTRDSPVLEGHEYEFCRTPACR